MTPSTSFDRATRLVNKALPPDILDAYLPSSFRVLGKVIDLGINAARRSQVDAFIKGLREIETLPQIQEKMREMERSDAVQIIGEGWMHEISSVSEPDIVSEFLGAPFVTRSVRFLALTKDGFQIYETSEIPEFRNHQLKTSFREPYRVFFSLIGRCHGAKMLDEGYTLGAIRTELEIGNF